MKKELFFIIFTIICIQAKVHAQATSSFGGTPAPGANQPNTAGSDYLGWANTVTVPLMIRTNNTTNPQNINFYTKNTQKMTIKGTLGTDDGYVGIGTTTASLTPSFQLDVASHINVNNPVYPLTGAGMDIGCFMINGLTVLHNQGLSNIYAGVAAGLSGFGVGNTFMGYQAGTVNVADYNVMIGYQAGFFNTTGAYNTFTGSQAGINNTMGAFNSFFGHHAGLSNTVGNENTFLGYHTGAGNISGNKNSVVGNDAALNLRTGSENAIMGFLASGSLRHGNNNTSIGSYSGRINQDNNENVFIGYNTGYATRADDNTFVGAWAGYNNTTAAANTFMGYASGFSNTTGVSNTFIGNQSGTGNVSTSGNTFLGDNCGSSNKADANTFAGAQAGQANITGTRNVYMGYQTGGSSVGDDNAFYGYNAGINNAGSQNTIVGSLAGIAAASSSNSTYIGYQSGTNADGKENTMTGSNSGLNTSYGYSNSFFGANTGIDIVGGYQNTFIGYRAGTDPTLPNLNQAVAIGDNAKVMMSQTMILGNNINVGIGLSGDPTGPTNMLEINSQAGSPSLSGLTFRQLLPASPIGIGSYGKVLTVDGAGNVVLTNDGTGGMAAANGTSLSGTTVVELGNALGGTAAALSSSREIPMRNYNVVFTDPSSPIDGSFNAVGIGTNSPGAKLDVNRVLSTPALAVVTPIGIRISSSDKSSTGSNSYALNSQVDGSNANNYGGSFTSQNARINTSVQGIAIQGLTAGGANDENRASQFDAENGRVNFGVLSKAIGGETTFGIDIDVSRGTIQNYGLRASVSSTAGTVINNYGINTNVSSSSSNFNYGSYSFSGGDKSKNFGVYGWAQSNTTSGTNSSNNIGGYFRAEKGNFNEGVYAEAISQSSSATSIGVYAKASGSTIQNYGFYAECVPACSSAVCVNTAGYFRGDVVSTTGYFISSDIKFKNNIVDINNGLNTISQLLPKTYDYQGAAFPSMTFPFGTHAGLIAEDVATVLPNVLKNALQPETHDSLGNVVNAAVDYLAVNYIEIIPYLIAAVKEQQQQINDLQTQLNNCCGTPRPQAPSQGNNEKTGAIDVKLINIENSILYQNEPNPYTSSTTIRYFIPENVTDVKITFQDATGKTLKEVKVNETGQGSIELDGSNLINGIYTYSLIAGNKLIDTKKMVKQ